MHTKRKRKRRKRKIIVVLSNGTKWSEIQRQKERAKSSESRQASSFLFCKLHKFKRTTGKIKFCSHICSCFVTADYQIHFTHATDFFCTKSYKRSFGSIWRLNGSEDKTYHRGGQNA